MNAPKKIIKDIVADCASHGIKGVELFTKVVGRIYEEQSLKDSVGDFSIDSIPDIVDEMVEEGDLIEIRYTLPSSMLPDRIRSFYLPKDTEIFYKVYETSH